jgi:hypothetical protein
VESYIWKAVEAAAQAHGIARGEYALIDEANYSPTRTESNMVAFPGFAGRYTLLLSQAALGFVTFESFLLSAQNDYRSTLIELSHQKFTLDVNAAVARVYGYVPQIEIIADAIASGDRWKLVAAKQNDLAAERMQRAKDINGIVELENLRAWAEENAINVGVQPPMELSRLS